MSRFITAFILATMVLAGVSTARASEDEQLSFEQKMMIVDGNRGRVIYDDGRDDLFCVTRWARVGYNHSGRPIYRRMMHCR